MLCYIYIWFVKEKNTNKMEYIIYCNVWYLFKINFLLNSNIYLLLTILMIKIFKIYKYFLYVILFNK